MCIYETQKFRDRKGAFPINKLWPRDIGDVAKEQNLVWLNKEMLRFPVSLSTILHPKENNVHLK